MKDLFSPNQLHEFEFEGRPCYVVEPQTPAPGRPWVWRARFFGAFPYADIELAKRGFHIVHIGVEDLFGSPVAVDIWNRFYEYIVPKFQLAPKVVLEGFSRGGLFVYNWAAENAEKVVCIYADAPVCDIRSWPGGKGNGKYYPQGWANCLKLYGLTEKTAADFKGNPIDKLQPLAQAGVPLLHVCGDADEVVPIEENTHILRDRYRALGGNITVIEKPGVLHHPHSLDPPDVIVDFIIKAVQERGN